MKAKNKWPLWSLKMAVKLFGRPTGVSEEVKQFIADQACVFIHIPKCAGNAVQKSLFGDIIFGHQTIRQYQISLPRDVYRKAWKFTVTRGPWERIVSAWRFLNAGGCNPNDKQFFDQNLSQYQSFDHFVNDWLVYQDLDHCGCLHFKPQMHYICEFDGSVAMDCIIKLSDLSNEYEELRQRFGGRALEVHNEAKGGEVDVSKFYQSSETYENIGRIYAEDIKSLGYTRE
jgi:hypothetical protein